MRLRYALVGALLSILVIVPIPQAQAQDYPYGDGLKFGDLREWFGEHFPGETELRNAIFRVGSCTTDDCWLTHGKVLLAMERVDDDGAGAQVAMGRVFFESRSGWHVTSEQLKGWIDDWLAWHVEQVDEAAAADDAAAAADDAAAAAAAAAAIEAAIEAALDALAADTTELPPWPEPTRTGETFQSHTLTCSNELAESCKYDTSQTTTCHVMSDGFIECE